MYLIFNQVELLKNSAV